MRRVRSRLRHVVNGLRNLKDAWALLRHAHDLKTQIDREGGFFRRPGVWYEQDIHDHAASVSTVAGAFAEIGVRHGVTFRKLVPIARQQGKVAFAVDSFEGTKWSSEFDSRPDYAMSIGGADVFFARMEDAGFGRDEYEALVGWIPEVFQNFPKEVAFSFVILDVDNYTPTRDSLEFVWPRMSAGGLLLLDDFVTHHQMDAARAIREFLRDRSDYWVERVLPNYQLILRKQHVVPPAEAMRSSVTR